MTLEEKIEQIHIQLKHVFEKFDEIDRSIKAQIGLVITEETTHTTEIKTKLDAIEKKLEAVEKKID